MIEEPRTSTSYKVGNVDDGTFRWIDVVAYMGSKYTESRVVVDSLKIGDDYVQVSIEFNGHITVRHGDKILYEFDPAMLEDAEHDKKRDDELTEVEG